MLRLFPEHHVRPVQSLDGTWDFVTADDRRDRAKLPKRWSRRIGVPQTWEQEPGLETYRGQAWYRCSVLDDGARALRLVFGGVSHTADVHIDGKAVAHHHDAFTPFEAVVPPKRGGGQRELVVAVDNSFGEASALHMMNDYYTYGGITRPVAVEYVPEAWIARVHAIPQRRRRGGWDLVVTIRVANWSDKALRRGLRAQIAGRAVDLGEVRVGAGKETTTTAPIEKLDVEAWSPDSPTLYGLCVQLLDGDQVIDDQCERVGFRVVAVKGKRLLVNGSAIKLRGYNRHEDHPQFGCAIPEAAMRHDLALLRDLGSNFVRTCHYPNDQRFLDLCDELGFWVWEEAHARTVNFDHPRFRDQAMASAVDMLEWHRNHPSIIIWGCLNECDSVSRSGKAEHEHLLKYLKRTDPSRPVTFASNRHQLDICLGLVDIVSWNHYTGWYGGDVPAVASRLEAELKWLHSPASKGGAGKPLIMSEFGAGAIYGNRSPNHAHWTEEYQCDVLDEELRVYMNHPDIVGTAIWQFCDIRVTPGKWWQKRPRCMNNKGTVDEYRRPKLAYEVVKKHFRGE